MALSTHESSASGARVDPAHAAYSPGLDGVLAGESAICHVDEGPAGLTYRGYSVGDLAEHATFEEVAYLLLLGLLPTPSELTEFRQSLNREWAIPTALEAFFHVAPREAHPMDVLRTAVSLLGMTERTTAEGLHERNLALSIRLLAQMPVVVTAAYRIARGSSTLQPRADLRYAENLLYLLTGRVETDEARAMARVLDLSLTLYAEHEFNASTFAARVTASTMTDMHAAITSAIGTLKGPLHGGANEAVAAMLRDIGSPDRAEAWVRKALAEKRRIMGFGHRVLKTGDSRSAIIQRHARRLSEACGDTRWYEVASIVDGVMREEKGLYPNLDFYTAVAYLLMGIPVELYTPVFVCSRITGWCAHVIEQQDHNRLIRPRALYTGPEPRPYVALDQRA